MRSGNRRQTPAPKPEAATPGKPRQKLSEIRCEKIASAREGSPLCGSPQSGKRGAPLRIFLAAKLYLVTSARGAPDMGWISWVDFGFGKGGPLFASHFCGFLHHPQGSICSRLSPRGWCSLAKRLASLLVGTSKSQPPGFSFHHWNAHPFERWPVRIVYCLSNYWLYYLNQVIVQCEN